MSQYSPRGHGIRLHGRADGVGAIGKLLRMDRDNVGNGTIGRNDDSACGHDVPVLCFHPCGISAFHVCDMRTVYSRGAIPPQRLDQARQILHRMKLALSGKPQAWSCIKTRHRRTIQKFDIGQAGPMGRLEFSFEIPNRAFRRKKEKTVEASKIAVDALGVDDRLDSGDCGRVALGGQLGDLFSANLFKMEVAVIQRACRCAVVRQVSPPPTGPSSKTMTDFP